MTATLQRFGHPTRAFVAELVGAAAVGKSTLIAEVRRRQPAIHWLQRARARDGALTMARRVVEFAPAWLAAVPRAPGYTWHHSRYFLRLSALEAAVRRADADPARVIIFEHGPIFTLARLQVFHDGPLPPSLARYAARLVARWATRLDLIIQLEAPLDVIAKRLDGRPKEHEMRDSTAEQLRDFVIRWDAAYADVLRELSRAGGPPILTLRTDQQPVTALADRLGAVLEERRRAS